MKTIYRTAHLTVRNVQDYDPAILREAKEKGYSQIGVSAGAWYVDDTWIDLLRHIGEDAVKLGLKLSVLTGYQRYGPQALTEHPEWRMVFHDGSYGAEACPFHADYKALYIAAMRKLVAVPGVGEIQLNDEAHLTDWRQHWGCYCPRCTELFKAETGQDPPREIDWSSALWHQWIKWRFVNWAQVHKEMYDAIKPTRPDVLLSTQFSPAVCLSWWNPWFSGVDIAGLADVMDLLLVDPYHTYHTHPFRPDIAYLTENIRYLKGAMGSKPFRIWTQGFVLPEFTRAFTPADGRWTAVLPLALGAEATTYWAYPLLQQIEDVAHAYEDSFQWDKYFAQTEPVQHVAVVQGTQTKTWLLTEMREGRSAYDQDYALPACRTLQRAHVLYEHVWDRRLAPENLKGFQALVLPRVACLSQAQGAALKDFAGGIVATSDTGYYDEEGRAAKKQAFEPLVKIGDWREFGGLALKDRSHPLAAAIEPLCVPLVTHAVEVRAGASARVLATFLDRDGHDTGVPAILVREGGQRFVYLAFEPRQVRAVDIASRQRMPDLCAALVAEAVRWAAGSQPMVWIEEPCTPGLEYFLSAGADVCVVTLGNYYLEKGTVTLRIAPPAGRRPALAYDTEARQRCPVESEGGTYRVQIPLDRKAIKIVAIHWG